VDGRSSYFSPDVPKSFLLVGEVSPGSVSNTEIDRGGLGNSIEIALYEISRSLGGYTYMP